MASNLHTLLKRDKEASINARYQAIKEYNDAYKRINSPKLIRLLSNSTNRILKVITLVLALAFLVIFATTIVFPDVYVNKISIGTVSSDEMEGKAGVVRLAGIVPLIIGLLLLWISYQISKLHKKNKTIARMSTLLDKIIASEKKNIEAEKDAYFQLLDVIDKDKTKPEIR
jgi:hypothetical protein